MSTVKQESVTWTKYWVTYYNLETGEIVAQYTDCDEHQLKMLINTTAYRVEYGVM